MKILQMSASYHASKLYKNMFKELDNKGVEQTVYVALKNIKHKNKNKIDTSNNIKFIYSSPFKRYDSYLYYSKIYKIYNDVIRKLDIKNINLTHAHFLFSDGGVAFELYKKHNIPYIVAIRNTDLNVFFKYGIHVRKYGVNILRHAKKIILLTESYRTTLFENYIPKGLHHELNEKMITIPNGIEDFWLHNYPNKVPKNLLTENRIRLIFVGSLNKNKNTNTILKVMEELEKENIEVSLKVVGNGELKSYLEKISKEKNLDVSFYGFISSKEQLLNLYKTSDIFIMPSIHETFGLVYIEAMSQGLPVLYTKGQGIYGYFEEGSIGYAANPLNVEEIKKNLLKIIENYPEISARAILKAQKFNWNSITDRYLKIYFEILKEEINC